MGAFCAQAERPRRTVKVRVGEPAVVVEPAKIIGNRGFRRGPSTTLKIGLKARMSAELRCAYTRDEGVLGSQFKLRASSCAFAHSVSGSRVLSPGPDRCSSSAVTISRCVFCGIFGLAFLNS